MRKRSHGDAAAKAAFARDVLHLFKHAYDPNYRGNHDREVRQVAFGLRLLRDLVDRQLALFQQRERDAAQRRAQALADDWRPASGIDDASAIIKALTSGSLPPGLATY
jgi:hypothetical protein